MSCRRAIIDRLEDLERALVECLQSLLEEPLDTDFHQLRITIKKLFAFEKLWKSINPDFQTKKMRDILRKIFKRAGSIRDLQVRILSLESLPVEKRIEKLKIKERIKEGEQIDNFIRWLTGFDLKSFHQMLTDMHVELENADLEITSNRLMGYFDRSILELKHMGQREFTKDRRLHAYRIQLKHFYYNLLFFLQRGHLHRTFQQDVNLIDDLQEELGRWHDLDLLIARMKRSKVKSKQIHKLSQEKEEAKLRIVRKQVNVNLVFRNILEYLPKLIQNLNRSKHSNPPTNVRFALR